MANRMKEDEKNEKIIRGLLKLPANRKCINCNSLGPQYVCTNFSIFICTNCSGIHREFTHRVKSVSMAKFTSQEVTNLQEGGNERAREIFFKEWDVQRNSFPDSSNIERLRTFIRHVYVDRRFTGEKPVDKPPRAKGDREDFEQRKLDMFRSGSRSPQYEDRFDRSGSGGRNDDRNFRYNYDEKRSPGYDQGDYRRSPRHFEIVDDRRRDDRTAIGNQNRRFEDRRFSDEVPKPDGSSPNNQKSADSSPVVRPVRDILGDNPPTLQVGELPKPHVPRTIDAPPTTQLPHASSSTGQAVVNPSEQKSLIDFGADPGPSVAAMPEPSVAPQPNLPANDANWASFDSVVVPNAPQNSKNVSSLESVLSQLSGPGSASTTTVPLPSNVSTDSSAMPTAVQLPNMQHPEPSLFSQPQNQSTVQPFAPSLVGGSSDQMKIQSVAATIAVPRNAFAGQAPPAFVAPNMESNVPVSVLPNPEAKPSGRKELPANLFASAYPVSYPSMMGFYNRPNFGMALPTQYPPPVPTFAYPTQSANPFDVSSEPNLAHAATFPSLASLQGALPNPVNSSNIMRSASLGSTSFPQLVPQNQLHHPFAAVPGGYIGQQFQTFNPGQQFQGNNPGQQFPISTPQQIPNTFHVGNHGIGNAPNQFATFGANTGFSQSGTSNVFHPAGSGSSSSNPFG